MTVVTDRWLLASDEGGARPITTVTVTIPGGDPVSLTVDGCVVTKSLDTGPRFTANVNAIRIPGQATLATVLTPGAIFTIDNGWNYGAGQTDTIPLGTYELGQQPKTSRNEPIPLALIDQWKRLEECRLLVPWVATAGAGRVDEVVALVTDAMPAVTIRILTGFSGGTVGTTTTWDRERTTAINDLARDGSFSAGFAADGAFEIGPLPALGAPVAAYNDGENATILDLSTEQKFTRYYNAVQMVPTEDQVWVATGVQVDDTDNPRDPSHIGVRPFFATAPTVSSSAQAKAVATAILPRVIGIAREVEISTWGQAHREPGETVTTTQAGNYVDGSDSATLLIESVIHNCLTVATTIVGRDAAVPIIEET